MSHSAPLSALKPECQRTPPRGSGPKLAGTRETIRSEPRVEPHISHSICIVSCETPGSNDLNNSFPNISLFQIPIIHHHQMRRTIHYNKKLHLLGACNLDLLSGITTPSDYHYDMQRTHIRFHYCTNIFLEALLESKGPINMANAPESRGWTRTIRKHRYQARRTTLPPPCTP